MTSAVNERPAGGAGVGGVRGRRPAAATGDGGERPVITAGEAALLGLIPARY